MQAILFDAVGTLIFPNPSAAQAYFQHGQNYGSNYDLNEVKHRFREARSKIFSVRSPESAKSVAGLLDGKHESNNEIERRLWFELVQYVFDNVSDIETLFTELWEHFASPAHWAVFPDVQACLESLKADGYFVAIASNFDSRLHKIVMQKKELATVDRVFCSTEVGFRKPDPRFYDSLASSLAATEPTKSGSPLQITMVGDDLENDSLTPTKIGWSGWFLDRLHRFPELENRMTSLEGLSEQLMQAKTNA